MDNSFNVPTPSELEALALSNINNDLDYPEQNKPKLKILPTPAELERLAIVAEELGEVQQIIGKIIRYGYDSVSECNPVDNNRKLLENELGDLLFGIEFLEEHGDISEDSVQNFINRKRVRIQKYLRFNTV